MSYVGTGTTSGGRRFGQERPPLSVTIKRILDEYPDGQIFKEMIQNADDAEAKTVWFYIDQRQHHSIDLPHPELANFLGPALVAANDACFKAEDWVGIQKLQQSIKAENPFKVGRFGIGFNSVYHITDMPIIVSGRDVGILDPQEKLWHGDTGRQFELREIRNSSIAYALNGLAKFHRGQSQYPHTIFRLPLRTKRSALSKNVYTVDKLKQLLDALYQEAKYLLLFLKSVSKIEVISVDTQSQHTTLFSVSIDPLKLQEIKLERSTLIGALRRAHQAESCRVSNRLGFEVPFDVTVRKGSHSETSQWLVATQVGSQNDDILELAEELKIFPWIGAAVELSSVRPSTGRVFCFLPLPVEVSSGLPIHVNGTFGLSDERRSLKWRSAERTNDSMAEWNVCLINSLLPECYFNLLLKVKERCSAEQFYRAWPDPDRIWGTNWSGLLQALYAQLLAVDCVWSAWSKCWVSPQHATFVEEGKHLENVVTHVLNQCGLTIVEAPETVWQALKHSQIPAPTITPSITRREIRQKAKTYQHESTKEKLTLLEYCLSDGRYSELIGIALLPLADGKFTAFGEARGSNLYICSKNFPKSLLPRQNHLLVDVSRDSPSLQSKLINVAQSVETQLRALSVEQVAKLLPASFPNQWRNYSVVSLPSFEFPSEWFEIFWHWVQSHSLHHFIELPILPIATRNIREGFQVTKLVRSHQSSVVILVNNCPQEMLSALNKLKVNCTNPIKYTPYVAQHSDLNEYVHNITNPKGILTAIGNANYTLPISVSFTDQEAIYLQIFLSSGYISNLTPTEQRVLENLPIFKVLNKSERFSVSQATLGPFQAILEPHGFQLTPENLPNTLIIFSRNDNSKTLFNYLLIDKPASMRDLIQNKIFPIIRQGQLSSTKLNALMKEIIELLPLLKREISSGVPITVYITELPFLPTASGARKAPNDLFDPTNTELRNLYLGEDVFPQSPFNKSELAAVLAQECGLRTSVTAQQLVDILIKISAKKSDFPVKVSELVHSRIQAIMSYILSHPNIIEEQISKPPHYLQFDRYFKYVASQYSCLPVLKSPPEGYPPALTWKGAQFKSHLVTFSAGIICCNSRTLSTLASLAGSQMYFVQVPHQLSTILPTSPQVGVVLNHFKTVLDLSQQCSSTALENTIKPAVYKVYEFLNGHLEELQQVLKSTTNMFLYNEEWIWLPRHRQFIRPQSAALNEHSAFTENQLEPFLHVLPQEMCKYSQLFLMFGAKDTFSTAQIVNVLSAIKHSSSQAVSPRKQWSVVTDILNWLTDMGHEPASSKVSSLTLLYVPVDSTAETPQLENVANVVYTDMPFLKKFYIAENKDYKFIHSSVEHLASALGARGLSKQLNISDDTFSDVGPYESIVTRLRNILKDYQDGLTIIKELLQNADDAEATEVNICYDARSHNADSSTLLLPGTTRCHGPALVVQNNKVFSDDDFRNIEKLAGATKSEQHLKIGKFGLGFCSVYHITDTPSFVSRDRLYIFDPTLEYLWEENQDRSKPGKSLKTTNKMVAFSNQLDPYNGLFGFKKGQHYQGTMFRFPFRTESSQLSRIKYNSSLVDQLVEEVKEAGSKLLLFLQHIKLVTFSRIDADRTEPTFLLTICRQDKQTVLSTGTSLTTSESAKLISVDIVEENAIKTTECWLVATYNDKVMVGSANKYGISSAACYIEKKTHERPFPIKVDGEMFCFLPLSIKTGLPLHISCNFAVKNDRSGIHSSDRGLLRRSSESEWNVELMRTVVPRAVHTLLMATQALCNKNSFSVDQYSFTSLWPLRSDLKIKNPWEELIQPTYELIIDSKLFYSTSQQKWLTINQIKVLSPLILCLAHQSSLPDCVVQVMESLQYPLVSMPTIYHQYLPQTAHYIIDEDQFLKVFFENFKSMAISLETRNEVLRLLLLRYAVTMTSTISSQSKYLRLYLTQNKSIPCKPNGAVVKYCSEVIDPESFFANLYTNEDQVFPIDGYDNKLCRAALEELGMICQQLPLRMVIERAKCIEAVYKTNKELALQRVAIILKCVGNAVKLSEGVPSELSELTRINFLPVMGPPKDYPNFLFWQGKPQLLCSCQDVVHGEANSKLAGSQVSIVCESSPERGGCGFVSYTVFRTLKISSTPSLSSVMKHLEYVSKKYTSLLKETPDIAHAKHKWVHEMSSQICKFFESALGTSEHNELNRLRKAKCLWTGEEFISPQCVAISWEKNGPILFTLPDILISKEKLIKALEIQETFTKPQLLKALESLHDSFSGDPIGSREMKLVEAIVSALNELLVEEDTVLDTSEQACYLPDEQRIMRDTTSLVYNDAQWCKLEGEHYVVHYNIPRPIVLKLGVKLIRAKALESYESSEQHFEGVEFGQHEELTQRIKNILSGYPFDITVIKELLQNADDAKAKKLYFILDKRNHGTNKLPKLEWKDLQGPAILVWNDMGFSDDDLKGIQKLGLGSKRSKSETIGQYGIGFNVVYHLTDCPSFVTNGNILCVMDPHLRYVPGATERKPGRMFDKVDAHFWENYSDMKKPYFQEGPMNCPSEIKEGGSLFRFPLRHNKRLVKQSLLIEDSDKEAAVIPASLMEENLLNWAPKMKDGLIFLNSVVELKFFVIESDDKMYLKFHFGATLNQKSVSLRAQIQQCASRFTLTGETTPNSVLYPITLTEAAPNKHSEEWIVKRGIGDSMNHEQRWQFLEYLRPNHGLAAPLGRSGFRGNMFCFLPLPMTSQLPVHVNGNFILDDTRSGLWRPRGDDRTRWNEHLIEAIASSYSDFVVLSQSFYIDNSYTDRSKLHESCQLYYQQFPYWLPSPHQTRKQTLIHSFSTEETVSESSDTAAGVVSEEESELDADSADAPQGEMKLLAKQMYTKLYEKNAQVHIVIWKEESATSESAGKKKGKQRTKLLTEFHSLTNNQDPSKQVYFWNSDILNRKVVPILKRIGIHLSVAPMWLREHFSEVGVQLPEGSPVTIFNYYKEFYAQVAQGREFPCSINATHFNSVEDFKIFTVYLLQKKNIESSTSPLVFPDEPWDLPLLVTADDQLSCLDEEAKVIHTSKDYSSIFKDSPESFLHSALLDIKYDRSYFVEGTEDNWSIIHDILLPAIPNALHNVHIVKDVTKHLPKDKIELLWNCLVDEHAFKFHLVSIVKEWALLLSTDGQGFSCQDTDQLLPVIPPRKPGESTSELEYLCYEVYEILTKNGMPELDISICKVVPCKKFCPQFSEPLVILSNMYHLYKTTPTCALYSRSVLNTSIKKLFKYLAKIHFAQDDCSLSRVRSLPIFCDIGHRYRSLQNEVYIWPGMVCMEGMKKWLHKYTIVFLPADGDWKCLTTKDCLHIGSISPLELYTKFIFPSFANFSQEERIKHLEHIRDTHELFNVAFVISKSTELIGRKDCELFIAALQQLPCLPIDGELKPLCHFCDPEEIIFQLFPDDLHFPPEELKTEEWLSFFRKIGMRTKSTKREFLTHCDKVSNGIHKDILTASKKLVEHLCSDEDWHSDEEFLDKVSVVPFVYVQKVPRVAWIKQPCAPSKVVQQGKKQFHLTTLRGSIVHSTRNSKISWTVRCLVELPQLQFSLYSKEQRVQIKTFLNNIGIYLDPEPDDVISNLINISTTEYAKHSLFHNYPDKLLATKRAYPLVEVVKEHFLYLRKSPNDVSLDRLKNVPCIPVSHVGSATDVTRPVLVKPLGVIAAHPNIVKQFLPILNPLPDDLFDLAYYIQQIGVDRQIQLQQVQFGLDTIKECVQHPYDPNTVRVIQKLLKYLYSLLPRRLAGSKDILSELKSPLYLPNKTHELVDSETLLFDDLGLHRNAPFDLSHTPYSFMFLLVKREQERDEYEFTAEDLYARLPLHVQPYALSKSSTAKLTDSCSLREEQSEFCTKLRTAFAFPQFADVVFVVLKHTQDEEQSRLFSDKLREFLECLNVCTVTDLKVDIHLTITNPPVKIGTSPSDFNLQETSNGSGYILYIDQRANPLKLNLLDTIASRIAGCVLALSESKVREPEKIIKTLMQAENTMQIQEYLRDLQINHSNLQLEEAINLEHKPKVGVQVPEQWHHRLQSDIFNIFRPQEMAALEVSEEQYIYVIVEYQLPGTSVTASSEDEDEEKVFEPDRYVIRVSEDEEADTKTVSVIDLFKILSVKQIRNDSDSTEIVLFDPNNESVRTWNAVKGDKLKDIMAEICDELRRIWRIQDEDTKRKAIKAMYLKWHPDKNSHPLATKAFQFLQQQLQRLNEGLPLEDPREDWEPDNQSTTRGGCYNFDWWDEIIRRRNQYWENEQRTHQRSRRGAGSGGGDWMNVTRVVPEPAKAKAWFEQAEYDIIAMRILLEQVSSEHSAEPKCSAHICFLACQVAEKSIKAGMYQVYGLQLEGLVHHKFVGYAGALEQEQGVVTAGLQFLSRSLEDYYVKTRYPNAFSPHAAPSNHFGPSDARQAAMVAGQILEIIRQIVCK